MTTHSRVKGAVVVQPLCHLDVALADGALYGSSEALAVKAGGDG